MQKWMAGVGLAVGAWLLAACATAMQPANVSSVTVEARDGEVVAVVQGEHRNACEQVGTAVQSVRGDTVAVGLLLEPPAPDMMCAQVMTPFTAEVPLDVTGLETGSYTVTVNGTSAEFTLGAPGPEAVATTPAEEAPAETSAPEVRAGEPAPVSSVTVEQREGQTVVVVSGELPDPCHEVQAGNAQVAGDTITVDVTVTPPPPDTMCAQVITPYTVEIPVEGELPAGAYQVDVNRQVTEVTVE